MGGKEPPVIICFGYLLKGFTQLALYSPYAEHRNCVTATGIQWEVKVMD